MEEIIDFVCKYNQWKIIKNQLPTKIPNEHDCAKHTNFTWERTAAASCKLGSKVSGTTWNYHIQAIIASLHCISFLLPNFQT
jgi:hypothetical protein